MAEGRDKREWNRVDEEELMLFSEYKFSIALTLRTIVMFYVLKKQNQPGCRDLKMKCKK